MKQRKIYLWSLALTSFIAFTSCNSSDDGESANSPQEQAINELADTYNQTMPDLFATKVWKNKPNRVMSVNPTKVDSLTTVYVYSNNTGGTKLDVSNQLTLKDFSETLEVTSATFSFYNDGTAIDSVQVAEREAREKLAPMVEKSKKYLKSKGLTDADIAEMLAENNADETQLVPFALALMEVEEDINAYSNVMYSPPSTGKQNPTQTTQIDWNKVGRCALQALGADVLSALWSSHVAGAWTVACLKATFKTVAKKTLGPIGAAIAVVEFAGCMGRA